MRMDVSVACCTVKLLINGCTLPLNGYVLCEEVQMRVRNLLHIRQCLALWHLHQAVACTNFKLACTSSLPFSSEVDTLCPWLHTIRRQEGPK